MGFFIPIKSISEANQSGYKSTILRPLYGIGVLCIAACIACFAFKVPDWIGIVFAIISFVIFGVAIFAYIYCLIKDRGALRSEWHSINQMAIQHGLLGDDTSGATTGQTISVPAHTQDHSKKIGGTNE